MKRILFTMDDVGFLYKELLYKGLGLWVAYIFCQIVSRQGRTFTFDETNGDRDYRVYLKSIRGVGVRQVVDFVRRKHIDWIIPTDVKDAQWLSYHQHFLSGITKMLVCPDPSWYDILDNKMSLHAMAKSLQIPVPPSLDGSSTECLKPFIQQHGGPYYWKKVCNTNGGNGVDKIDNKYSLNRLKTCRHREPYLLQAAVPGEMYSIDCLFRNGILVSVFGKHRISNGHRVSFRSYFFPKGDNHAAADPRVIALVLPAIRTIGQVSRYSGTMDLEFMVRGQQFWLIEINPRFSGGCYSWLNSEYMNDYLQLLEQPLSSGDTAGTSMPAGPPLAQLAMPKIRSSSECFASLKSHNILDFYKKRPMVLANLLNW